jgi:hypothetical protein
MGFFVPSSNERNQKMAVKLIANYAKRLGLPGYSSHQFSVSIETELQNVADVAGESERLYTSLQKAVDAQMQQTGFVPPEGYGMNGSHANGNGNGNGEHQRQAPTRDSGISPKQLELINTIVTDNNANKAEIDALCVELFGGGVRTLDRTQASSFIDELFIKFGRDRRNGHQRQPARA